MTEDAELQKIVKRELGNQGYVVNIHAHREGEYVVGRLAVTSAETDETVAKLVGVGNVNDVRLCFGLDMEGTLREFVLRALGTMESMRSLVPSIVITPPKS
ncbi:MAG TPA: hypothetical protein VJ397_04830 [Thermoplasmata archaeon]|nr:hypothetical protein [Thermoplasmata archaeon]